MLQYHFSLSWLLWAFLIASIITLFFLLYRRTQNSNKTKPNLPPSPRRLPFIGNLHQLGSLPHRSLRSLSQKHGPVMLLHLGRIPTVVVSSATAAQEIFKTHDLVFANRPDTSVGDRLLYGSKDIVFCKYGEYWRQLRRLCVVHLLSLRRVHSFRSIREEEVALVVDRIRAASSSSGPVVVNMSEMIITLTSNIICRVAFGRKYAEETMEGGGSRFRVLLSELMVLLAEFPMRDFMPLWSWVDWLRGLDGRVRKNAMEFDAFLEKVLEEHENKRERTHDHDDDDDSMDLVDILLSLGDQPDDSGFSLSRDGMKAINIDMFAGGTDTSYATIEWAMAELVRHPIKMKKAQEEVRRVVGPEEESIREEMVERMEYLKAVIKETLRLHLVVPLLIPRESMQDVQLLGYHIPKGTRVMINAWAIAMDPLSWEKPEEFWPERFLNNSNNNNVDLKGQEDFQFIPFGGGRRRCPGAGFAIPVTVLALANLLFHFDWGLPDGMRGEEMDMSEVYGIVTRMKSSLLLMPKTPNRYYKVKQDVLNGHGEYA